MAKRRTSRTERAEELRLLHEAGDDAWWGRPDTDAVQDVWRLVAPTLPAPLRHLITDFTAQQVLTVALTRCVQVGEEPEGRIKKTRKGRRTFSQNHLFDAVAPKWSRTFKTIAEVGRPGLVPTQHVYAQRRDSAVEARRQLLAVGIRLADIWKIIAGGWSKKKTGTNPLFYLTRPNAKLGYRVHLRDTEALAEFRRLLPAAPDRFKRLLLDTDPWPPREDRYQVCAERPFNGVEEDETVISLLKTLERTRLRFNVRNFKTDYDRWEQVVWKVGRWKTRVPYDRRTPFARRVRIARRLQIDLDAYRRVRGQVEGLPDEVLIKSRVFRDQEGRFHARHFWPQQVSGRFDETQGTGLEIIRHSRRDRWFSDRYGRTLGGFDIAGSQTQVLAVLLGLEDLEALTQRPRFTIKGYLAEQAMTRLPLRSTLTSPAELVPMMKDLWTRVLYGGHLKEIVWDHFDMLVPGTFTKAQYLAAVRDAKRRYPTNQRSAERARIYADAIKEATRNLEGFLEGIPWYGKRGEGKLSDFLRACEQVARSAVKRDIYAGVTFIDPFAGTTIRWNPPRRGRVRINCQGFQIALKLPGGWHGKRGTRNRRFIDAIPHHDSDDYPVSRQKLKQAVAPGVVHLIDALFNALVVRALERAGIVDFVALHDCWTVPIIAQPDQWENLPPYQRVLSDAIEEAGREWLERLGGIYAGLVDYLRGTEFEPWIRRLEAQWAKRVREKEWPNFRVEPVIGTVSVALEQEMTQAMAPVLEILRRLDVPRDGEDGPPPF